MGGIGSGRHHQGGKNTTSDYRSLDVRRLHREGLLTPGQTFGWNWTRDGETLASILMRTEAGKLMLIYPTMTARRGEPKRFGGGWAGRPVS